ncbi:capsid cement protein [Corynebacterium terpenotabidum]|uniref:DUF2190 domain-containing protein n=1 Tax=Corynebacterium terpenotabidum Y-11 TaxID=1200352 RepID=S4XLQ8_9CORY|nr:capsid cement protein [Corynebacterium terpenotabidum]AGP31523.1 hypothetical protein A606_09420 [Corynebacterium terpenotabidum Y-11]
MTIGFKNPARDRYNDGSDITAQATAAVVGKTFATIAGDLTAEGLPTVKTAATGGNTVGVVKYDADAGEKVGVARGSSRVITVTAGGAITAGDEVAVGAGGKAVKAAEGAVVVGYSFNTVAAGADALVSLNR